MLVTLSRLPWEVCFQGILHPKTSKQYTHKQNYNYYFKLLSEKKKILYHTQTYPDLILRNPLKFTAEETMTSSVCWGWWTSIFWTSREGLISALALPVLEEDRNGEWSAISKQSQKVYICKRLIGLIIINYFQIQPTIYGMCKTDYTVNAEENIATDVTLNRDPV